MDNKNAKRGVIEMKGKIKTVKLVVTGNVQRVGYRNVVSQIAQKLGITGNVRNLKNRNAQVNAQGTEEQLEKFTKAIFIQDWPIRVETVQTKPIVRTKRIKEFTILRGKSSQEIAERADVAALYMQKLTQVVAKEETLQKIGKEMAKEETLQRMRTEMAKEDTLQTIKAEVSKENTLEKFNQNTEKEFKDLDKKYGSISQKLDKLDKLELVADQLGKLSEAILVLASRK